MYSSWISHGFLLLILQFLHCQCVPTAHICGVDRSQHTCRYHSFGSAALCKLVCSRDL